MTPAEQDAGHPIPPHETDPTATPPDPDALAETSPGVQQLHRDVIQEETDPRDGFEPVPTWLYLVFGAVLVWSGYYLGVNSGDFRADVYDHHSPRLSAPPHPETGKTPAPLAAP